MPAHSDNSANSESSPFAEWDGSPLTKHAWYSDLPQRVRKYRTLWERGYVHSSKVNITASPEHSYHLSVDNVKTHSFEAPNKLKTFTKADTGVDDASLAKDKETRFNDSPETLVEFDKDLFDEIVSSIASKQKRKDYASLTHSSGLALLERLAAENAEADDDLAAWAATSRATLVNVGIENATCIAFDNFREKYHDYTSQMGDRDEGSAVHAKTSSCRRSPPTGT